MFNEEAIELKAPTEWFIPGNPKKYDVIGAFHKFRTADWKQSANVSAGDVVYIYTSGLIQAVRFKCRVKKVNVGDMDLEMLEEFLWPAFSKKTLENYGFSSPQNPVRVPARVKNYMDLIQKLKHSKEIDPDKYDGTYELLRETIRSYAEMDDLSVCNYKDLNLVYLMTVGTWKQKVPSKKKTVDESNLPELAKNKLKKLLDTILARGSNKEYENGEGTFGMFGTGFFTFKGKTDDFSPRKFIQACVDILDIDEDERIFDIMSKVLNKSFRGMQAASASMVLHCLKPFTFPIFNSNMGSDNIYEYLGVPLTNKTEVSTYIENCREVKKYRDENFSIKNYRIFDMAAWDLGGDKPKTDIDYLGVLDYLINNRDTPYSNPEAVGLTQVEKEHLLAVKQKGQTAVAEMKKMVALCSDYFELDKCEPISWLDGSNTRVREYLWAQMKYKQYGDSPISISVFVELSDETNKSRYRFCLETKNDNSDTKQMVRYHSYLDLPVEAHSSLVYVLARNEIGVPLVVNEPVYNIKRKIMDGTYNKVQLSRILEWTDELTNDDCELAMLEAVEALIPYYEHALGIKTTEEIEKMSSTIFDKNLILYGPPGTGKTYNSVIYAVAICDGRELDELTDYEEVLRRFNDLKEQNRIVFTTFHQSYGYEEFIEGIKPSISGSQASSGNVTYQIESGVFKSFCDVVKESNEKIKRSNLDFSEGVLQEEKQPYVFIIDEINRGNISKIFGELITLIEDTKREGMSEEVSATLPYSNKPFSVPQNVYIIGTMNTADRSLALLDTALRRRFSFVEMMPDANVLRSIGADKVEELDVAQMLEVINERIAHLYDREHTIGHAFFTCLKDDPSIERLQSIFEKSVIPLLQEYFYEDYRKIQMVLGDNGKKNPDLKFILDENIVTTSIFKEYKEDVIDLPEMKYSINKKALTNIQSYLEIM